MCSVQCKVTVIIIIIIISIIYLFKYFLQDKDQVELFLAAAHLGVCVFQNGSKINTFSW